MALLRNKYLHKIGKHLNRLDYLDTQLNCSVPRTENEEKPLKDLVAELKAKLDRYNKIWLEEKTILELVNEKHAELATKLKITPKRLSWGHSRLNVTHFEEKTKEMKSEYDKVVSEFSAIAEETKLMSKETEYVLNEESLKLIECKNISKRKLENLKNIHLEIYKREEDLRERNEKLASWINRCWYYLHYPFDQKKLFLTRIIE